MLREDALPEDELKESERQASASDLVLCLGTSLQITPACNLPLRTLKKGTYSPTHLSLILLEAYLKREVAMVFGVNADATSRHLRAICFTVR